MTQDHDSQITAAPESSSLAAPEGAGINIGMFLGIIRRKIWLILALGLAAGAISMVKNARIIPTYESKFRILIEPVRERKNLARLTDTVQGGTTLEFDYITQIEVLLSPEILTPILEEAAERYPDVNYGSIIGSLNLYRLGETKLLEMKYINSNPDKVKALMETIAQGYLEYSLEEQRSQLLQGLAFIDEKLPSIQDRVSLLQQQIQNLQQNYRFLEPESLANELFGRLSDITKARQALRDDFIALESQYNDLLEQAGASAALRQSAAYETMRQEYQVLRQQLAIESARFGPNSPTIQLILRQQANLAPLLFEEAERVIRDQIAQVTGQMDAIAARDRELATLEARLQEQTRDIPGVARSYQELIRELELATRSLARFQETKESLQIQASQNEIPWQLITPPTAPRIIPGTSPIKALMTGFVMGAALGLGIGYVLEKLSNTYYTLGDIKKQVPLPVLGIIPLHPELIESDPSKHVVDLRTESSATSLAADAQSLKAQLKEMLGAESAKLPQSKKTPRVQPTNLAQFKDMLGAEPAKLEPAKDMPRAKSANVESYLKLKKATAQPPVHQPRPFRIFKARIFKTQILKTRILKARIFKAMGPRPSWRKISAISKPSLKLPSIPVEKMSRAKSLMLPMAAPIVISPNQRIVG